MIIGLTGGIGSGKTTVAKIFETLGCIIYNTDEKAKQLYYHPSVKKQIIDLLGNDVYLTSGDINKLLIAQKVFSNKSLLHELNKIIHPAVSNDFIEFTSRYDKKDLIIKESALLFETNLHKTLDYTILVTAPLSIKIDRVIKRNNVSEEDVKKRMNTQLPDENKIPLANFVITNDNQTPLIPQVSDIVNHLKHQLSK